MVCLLHFGVHSTLVVKCVDTQLSTVCVGAGFKLNGEVCFVFLINWWWWPFNLDGGVVLRTMKGGCSLLGKNCTQNSFTFLVVFYVQVRRV